MGYIKRNFSQGDDLLDDILTAIAENRNCVTVDAEWKTTCWFGSLERSSDCFEMTQNVSYPPILNRTICEPPKPPNYAQSDPNCSKNENNTQYYFYTGAAVRGGTDPVCSLITEDGLIYDDPITPETWACLERWCNDIVDYDKPFCEYRGTIMIIEKYDFKYCAPDSLSAQALLSSFEVRPKNTEPEFVTTQTFDFMKPLIGKALSCICEAIRQRDVRKLEDALRFLNHDHTFQGCRSRAFRECNEELGFGPIINWTDEQYDEYFDCVARRVEVCMQEYVDELLCFD